VWLGVGEALSGFIMGSIIDKFGSKYSCLMNITIVIVTIIVQIIDV
jgi:hypothetical protein